MAYEVEFIRIPRDDESSEKLYRLEEKRNELIKRCAEEWLKIVGLTKQDFWTKALPTALFDLLESFDLNASKAACEFFLKFHAERGTFEDKKR